MPVVCKNCGNQLSCGCQRRTASDGTECCDTCVNAYEAKVTELRALQPNMPVQPPNNG
jgi:hypothetical protein